MSKRFGDATHLELSDRQTRFSLYDKSACNIIFQQLIDPSSPLSNLCQIRVLQDIEIRHQTHRLFIHQHGPGCYPS